MKLFHTKTRVYAATFLLTLVTVVVTLNVVPANIAFGGNVDADKLCADGGSEKYQKIARTSSTADAIDMLVECYHDTMNASFNSAIKAVVKLATTGKDDDLKEMILSVTPPKADENGIRAGCNADHNNHSTYCLSQNGIIEYTSFRTGMISLRERIKANAADDELQLTQGFKKKIREGANPPNDGSVAAMQIHLFDTYGAKMQRIDNEVAIAQKSLDLALDSYNELQFALPLHLKYKQIIKSLSGEYIPKLAKIRRSVALYPVTFVDVTTPACN